MKTTITINIPYVPPSINKLKWAHWTKAHKESRIAKTALMFALRSEGEGYSTRTMPTLQSKTCWMAFETLASFLMTQKKESLLKSAKRKQEKAKMKELESRLITDALTRKRNSRKVRDRR